MSDVENFINDDDFIALYESCAAEIELAKKDDNYCMNEAIQSKPMHTTALLDATYYFDYEIPDEIIKEFPNKIYEQSFIIRTIKTNLIRAIFDDYDDLLERFSIIRGEVISLRKKSTQIRKELVAQKFSDKEMVTSHSGLLYAHNMCCSVRLLYDESENVSKLATKQAGNLCLVRTEILANVKNETDAIVLLLTKSRLHEIEEHVQRVTAADACKFTPRPRG